MDIKKEGSLKWVKNYTLNIYRIYKYIYIYRICEYIITYIELLLDGMFFKNYLLVVSLHFLRCQKDFVCVSINEETYKK